MQSFFGRSIQLISSRTANFKSGLFRQPLARGFLSNSNAFESADDFEERIFGNSVEKDSSSSDSFFKKLDRIRDRGRSGTGTFGLDGLDEDSDAHGDFVDTLNDGVDGKLKRAATDFHYDSDEVQQEDYMFRPDMTFLPRQTYDTKDLDLTKPGIRKPVKREEFQTTTEEVMRKADFRNVRFLSNFITEAGILNKRSKTGIRAKAQRKVAREIKTARAFGLMPFTTMGTKAFAFGRNMEDLDDDYEQRPIRRRPMDDDFAENNPFGNNKGFGQL